LKYKEHLKVNASQVCWKNAEAWRTFFALLKAKKNGKPLKPRPPGYWKRKHERRMVLVRNDRYIVDDDSRAIYLKDLLILRGGLSGRGSRVGWRYFTMGFVGICLFL
jgi:putative transposase